MKLCKPFFIFEFHYISTSPNCSLKFMIETCVIKNWQKIEVRKLRAQSSKDVHLDVIFWGFLLGLISSEARCRTFNVLTFLSNIIQISLNAHFVLAREYLIVCFPKKDIIA